MTAVWKLVNCDSSCMCGPVSAPLVRSNVTSYGRGVKTKRRLRLRKCEFAAKLVLTTDLCGGGII